MTPLRLLLQGAGGRMGRAIRACATPESGCTIAEPGAAWDAAIDFSQPAATRALAERCVAENKALVIGTTGHSEAEIAAIREAAARVPVVFAPNFSVGVNALFWLTQKAAEIAGADFDLEVVEMHHRLKKDAPSGTAKRLGEILAEVRAVAYREAARHGREGIVGVRTDAEIGMHAIRGGDVVGEHTVILAGSGERLELTHKASSRDTFARGALRAALWAHGRAPGLYDMQDVLGLR